MNDGLDKAVKDKIISVLSALFPNAKIYLFGSRATGKYQRTSDIDIAIDAGARLPVESIGEAKDVMESLNIVYKVDVLDLYNISSDFRDSILKNKVIWKN